MKRVTPNMFTKAFDNLIVPDFLSNHKFKIKQEKNGPILWPTWTTIVVALCIKKKSDWVCSDGKILIR